MIERRGFIQALLAAPAAFAAVMMKPRVPRSATAGLLMNDERQILSDQIAFYSSPAVYLNGDGDLWVYQGSEPIQFTSGTAVPR